MICNRLKYVLLVILLLSLMTAVSGAKEKWGAQRLTADQLLFRLRSLKNPSFSTAGTDGSAQDVKCGFGIQAQISSRWKEFTPAQQVELSALLKKDILPFDTIAGHFHIHYDTAQNNAPAMLDNNNQRIPGSAKTYIHEVAQIFNHVWDVEIDHMGYSAPPFESGQSTYNVYVEDIGDYGDTWRIDPPVNGAEIPSRYQSYIVVDNDYKEFNSRGIGGLEVTAAHEFHHAIQIGSYGLWENDLYAYELTSTWFEDVVYSEVNDYYNYLPNYFGGFSGGLAFNSNSYSGYERSIWAHFLAKRFGPDLMRDVWTAMRAQPFLESSDSVLKSPSWGSSLQSAFAEFTKWNYFTFDHADTVQYYPEGRHYPRYQPLQTVNFYNTTSTTSGSVESLSSSMYEFDLPQDTVTAIIANVDVENAVQRNTAEHTVGITLSSQSLSPPYQNLANGLKVKISVDTPSLWSSVYMQYSNGLITRVQTNAAPNPFRLAEAPWLKLPINQDAAKTAEVFFYSSSFQLVYAGSISVSNDDGFRAIVVPVSEVKSKLSSGIYFVLAKTPTSDYKWKVAVIR